MSGKSTPLEPLESILCTEELNRRPARPPDFERESRALGSLAHALADSPRTILQTLADTILEVFQADSVGISLVSEDGTGFRWPAIAGAWKPHIGGGTPRDFGPCGDVLDHDCPLLFCHPERRYPYFQAVNPPVEECLLIPFYVEGQAVGTIWAIAHNDRRKFDSEDLRMLVSLGAFASAAYQSVEQSHAINEQARGRQEVAHGLREMNEALLISSVKQHELTEKAEKAEEAAHKSEKRFRALVTASSDVVYRMSPDWSEMRQLDGRNFIADTEQPSDTWLQEYIPPDDQPHVLAIINEAVRTKTIFELEHRVRRLDGTLGWTFSRAVPLLDARGEIVEWFGTASDVTERKRAEDALRDSEERYRNLFTSMDEGYCIMEVIFDGNETPVDYRFLEVNPSFEKHSGLHNATGKRIRELHPDLEEHWFETYGKVALTGEPVRFVNEAKALEGRWFDVYAFRVGGRDSRKVAVLFNDITQRRASEETLRQIERSLRFIMDSMPQKIFTARPNGDIDYFNPQWTEFTGMSFEQMQDSGWTRFVHPDDLAEKTQHWRHAFETGEPFQSEHRFRRADGEYRWHFSRAVPMRDEAGRITMWVGSNTDVHDIKLVEAVLQEQAAELSDLHRRKDEFLAMLSHELRSPLAPISNAVQLLGLQRGSESPIQQQARSIIERQLGQLQHLVDDLLEVSRITSGKVQLRLERVAVKDIVTSAVETVRPLIEQRQHELTVSLPQEPIWLHADAARLQQVLVNLLTNAAKYTEEGGHVWLTVEEVSGTTLAAGSSPGHSTLGHPTITAASALPLTGSNVVIRVRDSGSGIAAELLPHIFDIFTQAERSLDRSQGGLGIGLALVKRLTELHGGNVEASSVIGQGSEFVVRLPSLPPDTLPPLVADIRLPNLRTLRVLVVDDNVDSAETLGMLLRASGHDVRTAHDGPTALNAALEYVPDAVFLDIGLPLMNGYEVAKRIRQQPDLENVVLIALTGYGQDTDRLASLLAGFEHHLVKPARLEQMLHILEIAAERKF